MNSLKVSEGTLEEFFKYIRKNRCNIIVNITTSQINFKATNNYRHISFHLNWNNIIQRVICINGVNFVEKFLNLI